MTDVVIRPVRPDDAEAIADVCNAETKALYGEADVDEAGVRGWMDLPDIGLVVAELDGQVLGYGDVQRGDGGTRFPIDVRVHPEAPVEEVAGALVDGLTAWAEERAEPGAQLRTFVAERHAPYRAAVERRGYELIRHSFTMEIELPETIDPPEWPGGISVRTYEPERDERAVYECVQEAFADHWDFHPVPFESFRSFRDADPRFAPALWWLAEDGPDLAGVSLNAWYWSGDPTHGWIGTLAVRRPWRRRGLALALLRHSFRDFTARGATRVGLGVDAENTTGAVRLYEKAGMRPVRRNDQYSKAL